MTDRPVRHSDLRKTGLIVALGVGLLVLATVGFVILNNQGKTPATPTAGDVKPQPPPVLDTDLTQIGMKADKATVQFIDRQDPNRTAGMMKWKKLEPETAGKSKLTDPEGYIYLRDGGIVIISSKMGRLFTPPRQSEPESGVFEGDVRLRVFGPGPNGTPPDIAKDKPLVTATTESLSFQLAEGEVSTQDAFHIRSARVDFDGRGMLLRINQVEESIRLFEVAHVDRLLIRPDAEQPNAPNPRQVVDQNGVKIPAPGGGAHTPRKRIFRAVVDDTVHIAQGLRTMDADRVECWALLVNNQLPDGAIARLGPDPGPTAQGGKPTLTPGSEREQIEATWKGRLIIKPVEQFPSDFPENSFALRLLGGARGPVKVEDDTLFLDASAPQVDYAATTRMLNLRASAADPVTINTPTIGTLTCNSAVMGLATGKAALSGPGTISPAKTLVVVPAIKPDGSAADPAAAPKPAVTTLTFTDFLDLQFAAPRNWIEPTVLSANIRGGFIANSGDITATGDEADVTFHPPSEAAKRTPINKITLRGHAHASSPGQPLIPGGQPTQETIDGREMTVQFLTDAKTGREEPAAIHVKGDAVAAARGYTVRADAMEAQLKHDEQGKLYIQTAAAEGNAKATDAKGLSASADRIVTEPRGGEDKAGLLTLSGMPVTVYRDGTTMTGPLVRLTAANGELYVDGAGAINTLRESDNHTPTTIKATWTKYMRFTNTTGQADCVGDTVTTMEVGEEERDTLKAERIVLAFPPAASVKPDGPRDLISAEAKGSPSGPAKLEHRRFVTITGEKKTERLVYLEGSSIIADQIKRTLLVPEAGKLLVDDRRAMASVNDQPGAIANIGDVSNTRGTSLFTWGGLMSMSLPESTIQMKRDVRLTHQPAAVGNAGARPITLECQDLQAWLLTKQKPGANAIESLEATLTKVEARGGEVGTGNGVHASSDGKDLYCYTLIFDAAAATLEASGGQAGPDELVTLQDPARSAPLRARQIIWNQKAGEFRLIDPAPATIGR